MKLKRRVPKPKPVLTTAQVFDLILSAIEGVADGITRIGLPEDYARVLIGTALQAIGGEMLDSKVTQGSIQCH